MSKFLHKLVSIKKLKNNRTDGKTPKIKDGEIHNGFLSIFEIGHSAFITDKRGYFVTTPIIKIDEDNGTFETKNSTYSITLNI